MSVGRSITRCLIAGLIATLASTRVDDAARLINRSATSTLYAGEVGLVLTQTTGFASSFTTMSRYREPSPATPAEVRHAARRAAWTDDPLVGFVALSEPGPPVTTFVWSQGWPWPAFVAHRTHSTAQGHSKIHGGLEVSDSREPVVIAYRPHLPGLIADTLLFVGAFAAVFIAPGAIRSHVRRRSGRCGSCGYSLKGLVDVSRCPECGDDASNRSLAEARVPRPAGVGDASSAITHAP